MSERKFRFVSPGVFIQEIDKSQLDVQARRRGPMIAGRSERGPAMRPVLVNTFNEFVKLFGNPIPGGRSGDIWRVGNYTAPTYASYAAQAYLRNNNPITFVRLLGVKHGTTSTAAGIPGWTLTEYDGTGGGAQGLFIVDSGSAANGQEIVSGTLAAVWYFSNTTDGIKIKGHPLGCNPGATSESTAQGLLIASKGDTYEFEGAFYGTSMPTQPVKFNFDRDSDHYIRKVFNTNPTLANSNTNTTAQRYWLGESYEGTLGDVLNSSSAGKVMGVILPLKTPTNAAADEQGANFRRDSDYGRTGWIFSQDNNLDSASFDSRLENDEMNKLFRFESLDRGSWSSRNLKISIRDISFSKTKHDDYGTFTVLVRNARDTDSDIEVFERFENVNLNPESANYISRVIGDKSVAWDENTSTLRELGLYDNMSKFIRIDIHSSFENGGAEGLLPAGFVGPPVYNTFHAISGAGNPVDYNLKATDLQNNIFVTGAAGVSGREADSWIHVSGANGVVNLSASIAFPQIKLRNTSNDATLPKPSDAFFGLDTRRGNPASGRLFDPTFYDLVRGKPGAIDNHVSSSIAGKRLFFSLDDLSASYSGSDDYNIKAVYAKGTRAARKSITSHYLKAVGGGISGSFKGASAETGSFQLLLDVGYDKFTTPIFGGFDGFDITEREPLRNSLMDSDSTKQSSYVFNTYSRAIDMVLEQNGLDINLACVPGLTLANLTNKLLVNCEERGDVLGIVDLDNDYIPRYERTTAGNGLTEASNIGNATTAVTTLRNRQLNTSYGCAYYPWVLIKDTTTTGQNIWVPPSVVALGVMGNSEAAGELWFAPAGFTRGGLSEGASGLTVLGVRQKLSAKERDNLYEQNINPIASFPAEGIVIFGQKTLQLTRSALDRVNVRRLLIFLKKEISFAASRVLFDQNIPSTWARFASRVNPLLLDVQTRFGITDFKLVLDESTTTDELVDRNIMYAKLFIKPARAIEYIALDFIITSTGASFEE
jgi:hypothetical protein